MKIGEKKRKLKSYRFPQDKVSTLNLTPNKEPPSSSFKLNRGNAGM